MSIYPRPRDTCPKCLRCEGTLHYLSCSDWLKWFRWWWNRFNAFAKEDGIKPDTPPETVEEMEEEA